MENPLSCFFFIPGLSEKYRSGGLLVTRDVADIFEKQLGYKTYFVATHEKHPDAITPDEAFKKNPVFLHTTYSIPTYYIVTWGPLIEEHIKLIQKNIPSARILYYAQSFGWNIRVPPRIPIVCVSHFVLNQWTAHDPERFYAYIPPPLHPYFSFSEKTRDIDILVHTRKQNDYCLKKLLPALQRENVKITTIDTWISRKEFADLLKRTKIFLYITKLHKAGIFRRLPGEGFGLPALEALACGAMVVSNLIGGVTDFLTPGENCVKVQSGNLEFDVDQICRVVKNFSMPSTISQKITSEYSVVAVAARWRSVLRSLQGEFI